MSNPSKDPKFNETLRRMLDAKPKQNKDMKVGTKPPHGGKSKPKAHD